MNFLSRYKHTVENWSIGFTEHRFNELQSSQIIVAFSLNNTYAMKPHMNKHKFYINHNVRIRKQCGISDFRYK